MLKVKLFLIFKCFKFCIQGHLGLYECNRRQRFDILYLILCFAIEILIDGHPLKLQNTVMSV